MFKIKNTVIGLSLLFFTACGTEDYVDTNRPFDMWEYMTSSSNYEVEYAIYENGQQVDYYQETHRQLGRQYIRESTGAITRLFLSAGSIEMQEPNNNTSIPKFLYLGDRNVFHSTNRRICDFNNFYNNYKNFHNVIQITCKSPTGFYQEFYYGYNEGIVSIYEEFNGQTTEYIKVRERAIF